MILNNYEILTLTKDLMIEIHRLTVQLSGLQMMAGKPVITGSMYSVTTALSDTYCSRKYSYEFIKNLVSTHTTKDSNNHLETLFEKGSLNKENFYAALKDKLDNLVSMVDGLKPPSESELSADS